MSAGLSHVTNDLDVGQSPTLAHPAAPLAVN